MMAKDFIGNEITVGCNVVYSGQRHHLEVFMPVRVRAYEQIMRELLEDLTIP
jgi:hypothetical protein